MASKARSTDVALTAIYTRISHDTKQGAGVERQLKECRERVKREGWRLTPEKYDDNDISASRFSKKPRPSYRRLLADVEAGRIARIVVWNTDRLYRRVIELEKLIELAEHGKVEIVSVTGGELNLSNHDGRFMARTLVNLSQRESEATSSRLRAQRRQARERGFAFGGGVRLFGWNRDWTPNKAEAKLVVAAIDRALDGESLNAIARDWNARAVMGTRGNGTPGKIWTHSRLRDVLTNPRHAGLVMQPRAGVAHYRFKSEDVIRDSAKHPGIVDRDKWLQLVDVLNGRGSTPSNASRRTLLTGLLRCGVCDSVMRRGYAVWGERKYPYWRCMRSPVHADHACGKNRVPVGPLEAAILDALFRHVDKMPLVSLVGQDERGEQERTYTELQELNKREDEYAALRTRNQMSSQAFERALSDIAARRAELNANLSSEMRWSVLGKFAGQPGALKKAWPGLVMDQRREIVKVAVGCFTILPAVRRWMHTFDEDRIEIGHLREVRLDTRAS